MYSLSSSGLPVSRGLFDFEKKDPPSQTFRQIHVPYENVVLNNQTFTHRFILLKWEYAGWEYIGGETLDSTGKVVMRLFGAYVHSERKNRYESIFDAADSMDQMMLDMCNNLFDQSGRPTGNFKKKLKENACWYGDGYDIGNILFIQGVYARTADEDMYRDMGLHDDMVRSLIYNMGWLKEKNGIIYDVKNREPEDDVNLDELEEEEKYDFDVTVVIGDGVENCKKRFQKIAEKGKQKDLYFMLPHEIGWPFCPRENGVAPPMTSNNVDNPNEGLQGNVNRDDDEPANASNGNPTDSLNPDAISSQDRVSTAVTVDVTSSKEVNASVQPDGASNDATTSNQESNPNTISSNNDVRNKGLETPDQPEDVGQSDTKIGKRKHDDLE